MATNSASDSTSNRGKAAWFQDLGGGTYRVNGVMRRNAVTGRYVSADRRTEQSIRISKARREQTRD